MACALSGSSSCAISAMASSSRLLLRDFQPKRRLPVSYCLKVRASSGDSDDCNEEECAPDKEIGKVSMEWVAEDKTKVTGTFPPRNRGWTGYVEKDTAGQTNIYSVEPVVYVAESAISSGTSGTSADGSQNTLAIAAGLALISVAAASSVLIQVDKKTPVSVQKTDYSGPSLTYYINKFKPQEFIEASVPPEIEEAQPDIPATNASETSEFIEASASPPAEISAITSQTETSVQEVLPETTTTNPSEISPVSLEPDTLTRL